MVTRNINVPDAIYEELKKRKRMMVRVELKEGRLSMVETGKEEYKGAHIVDKYCEEYNLPMMKRELLEEWLAYRREIKKPISSDRSIKSNVMKFYKNDYKSLRKAITDSVDNQWQGLFINKTSGGDDNLKVHYL